MKNYILILLMLFTLTGCGYEIISSETVKGVTYLELSGENTETKKVEKFCQKNANESDSKTICAITNSSGETNEVTIKNFKFEESSSNVDGDTTNITIVTNVQGEEDLSEYCTNNYAKDTIFTNCVFKHDGGEYQSFTTNPDLYDEIEYMLFDEGIMTTYNENAEIIKDYKLSKPEQVIITPGYIYFHIIESIGMYEGDKYQVFDTFKQEFIGEINSESPLNISYSNGKTLLSKIEPGEVCELSGTVELSCFNIVKTESTMAYSATDAWYDGEKTIYALVTNRDIVTEIHQYDAAGSSLAPPQTVWAGIGDVRFYELSEGNPILFSPKLKYPSSILYASYSSTLMQKLEDKSTVADVSKPLYDELLLNMMDYDVFKLNQDPVSGDHNIAFKEGTAQEMVLQKLIGDHVEDVTIIKHPFYVDYTSNKFSDFFYHFGGDTPPTYLEYSFNGDKVCTNEMAREKDGYTFKCDGEVILSAEENSGISPDAVIAI